MSIRCVSLEASLPIGVSDPLSAHEHRTTVPESADTFHRNSPSSISPTRLGKRTLEDLSNRLKDTFEAKQAELRPPPHALRPISSFSLAHQHTIPAFSEPLTPPESPIKSTIPMVDGSIPPIELSTPPDNHSNPLNALSTVPDGCEGSDASHPQTTISTHLQMKPCYGQRESGERNPRTKSFTSTGQTNSKAASQPSRSCSPHKRGKTLPDLSDIFYGSHSSAPVKLGLSPSAGPEDSPPPTPVQGFISRPSKLHKRSQTSSRSTIASWFGFGSSPAQSDSESFCSRWPSPRPLESNTWEGTAKGTTSSCKNFQELLLNSDADPLLDFDAAAELQSFAISSGALQPDSNVDLILTHATALLNSFCIAYRTKHASLLTILEAHDELQEDFDSLTSSQESTFEELLESRERVRLLRNQLRDLGLRIEELEGHLGEREKERGRWLEYQRGHECLFDRSKEESPYIKSTRPYSSSSSIMSTSSAEEIGYGSNVHKPCARSSASFAASSTKHGSRCSSKQTAQSAGRNATGPSSDVNSLEHEPVTLKMSATDGAPFLPPKEVAGAHQLIQQENMMLKVRIKQLEDTLEGCLGLVA